VVERPRRHSKPRIARDADEPYAKLIVAGGRAEGLEPADVIHVFTAHAGLDGEAVRDVRVLERFSFVSVPAAEADRVIAAVDGTPVNGSKLRIELARA
jgi:ATP-dependent RNA helicase DeaD